MLLDIIGVLQGSSVLNSIGLWKKLIYQFTNYTVILMSPMIIAFCLTGNCKLNHLQKCVKGKVMMSEQVNIHYFLQCIQVIAGIHMVKLTR